MNQRGGNPREVPQQGGEDVVMGNNCDCRSSSGGKMAGHCGQILSTHQVAAGDVDQQSMCLQEVSAEEWALYILDDKVSGEGLAS